jgi:hypothetical protein
VSGATKIQADILLIATRSRLAEVLGEPIDRNVLQRVEVEEAKLIRSSVGTQFRQELTERASPGGNFEGWSPRVLRPAARTLPTQPGGLYNYRLQRPPI